MNIKQVRYYVEAVSKGSLSAAAKDMYVTVQAISKAIVNLEKELDCDLLERGCRGVQPTAPGKAFYQKALVAIESFTELETFPQTYRKLDGQTEDLRLGLNTPPFYGNEQIRKNVARFVENQLNIETSVALATGERGFGDLRAGLIDALITIGVYHHEKVTCEVIGTLLPAVMMEKGHPLAKRRAVSLADLAPYPVANPGWFSSFNSTVAAAYRKRASNLTFVDLEPEDALDHLHNRNGVILTTDIDALAKTHLDSVFVPIAAEDSMPIPICRVSMEGSVSRALLRLQGLLLNALMFVNHGKVLSGDVAGSLAS